MNLVSANCATASVSPSLNQCFHRTLKVFRGPRPCPITSANMQERGFIVKASAQALESVHALSEDYKPTIEDDQTVTTQQ